VKKKHRKRKEALDGLVQRAVIWTCKNHASLSPSSHRHRR